MDTGGLYEPELGWTNDERSDAGSEVLAAIIHKSGLFEVVGSEKKREYRQRKASWVKSTQLQLGFTEKAMAARKELAEHSYMFHPPMVVMPQQWPQKGPECPNRPLGGGPVRAREQDAEGSLQGTAQASGGTPRATEGVGAAGHRDQAQERDQIPAQQLHFEQTLETATRLADFERFYVPVAADFRGRIVPISTFHCHLADPFRALFQFADGKPLGDYGLGWLMVRLANSGEFEKVHKKCFEARRQWVEDNLSWILDCAHEPLVNRKWTEAKEPFQFLAAAMELAGALSVAGASEYVSHLAIDLDGSNNGLQHYSAIMRSTKEAALVNLIEFR